jgi:ribosomal protein L37AE/L43A
MIVFHCPHCDRSITLQDASQTTVVCAHCKREVAVPEFEQTPTLPEFPVPQPEELTERS